MWSLQKGKSLVLDSRCHLPERLSLPMASDLALSTQPEDTPGAFVGASIDFKAAHKQVQARPEEHGLLLFAFQEKLYHYRVCHFGGRFWAFWSQRTGAFLLRQLQWAVGLEAPQSLPFRGRPAARTCPRQRFRLLRLFRGKRRSSRTASFGVAGRSSHSACVR